MALTTWGITDFTLKTSDITEPYYASGTAMPGYPVVTLEGGKMIAAETKTFIEKRKARMMGKADLVKIYIRKDY